jgi:hypothetical protein
MTGGQWHTVSGGAGARVRLRFEIRTSGQPLTRVRLPGMVAGIGHGWTPDGLALGYGKKGEKSRGAGPIERAQEALKN